MNKRKIMFFDIDGTLLSETTHEIPNSTIDALRKAKEAGHLIFINTGRPFSTINECIKELNLDGYVCGCGTYIAYNDKVLMSKSLPKQSCLDIINLAKKTNIDILLESKDAVYFDKTIRHPVLRNMRDLYLKYNFVVKNFDDDISFDKFAIWFDGNSNINHFKKEIENDFNYIVRGPDFGEIIPTGYSKATGIQFLLDYFKIDIDDCYVFGDSSNDESMLRYVKHAVVMGNGEPYLFEHAFYVTKNIDDDGIQHALEYLKLI